jgi:general secretion pathway protein D
LLLGGSDAQSSLTFPANQDALTGLALGVRGPEIEGSSQLVGVSVPAFGVALNALATSGDADILSTPHIIALDNEEAEISVGANVPLQTSGLGGGLGNLAGLAGLSGGAQVPGGAAGLAGLAGLAGSGFGAVPRQDVGTTIRLTPHINEADEIRFEIQEEISEADASTEGTLGVRSVNKRTAKTQLVVRDQQTVVIGGLMRDTVLLEETKIPILGDIPLLGVLFRQTQRSTEKRNLLLFLTPYIIRDQSDLRAIFERKMRERQEFIDRYFVFGDHDYEPPIDYSRTRGMMAEILNELDEIAVERALYEEAQARPPPDHVPRPPVGAAPDIQPEDGGGDVVITPGGVEDPGVDLPGSVNEEPPQGEEE